MNQEVCEIVFILTILISQFSDGSYNFMGLTGDVFQFQHRLLDLKSEHQMNAISDSELDQGNSADGHCRTSMLMFSQLTSQLTLCILNHSRPFRICERCISEYMDVVNLYSKLKTDVNCSSSLLMADRMGVITSIYQSYSDIWNSAHCPNCFDTSTGNFTFTNDTKKFLSIMENVTKCINISHNRMQNLLQSEESDNDTICKWCKDYKKLNQHFEKMSNQLNGEVCMDLVDMLNDTQRIFNCPRPLTGTLPIIMISVVVGLLIPALYVTSRCLAKLRQFKPFAETRLATRRQYIYGAVNPNDATENGAA